MALTRDFKETIRARVARDPKFRRELSVNQTPVPAGEYEKAHPNRGRCGVPDDSARQAALPERGAFRNYWPF